MTYIMFTGLIEAVGRLKSANRSEGGAALEIGCPEWDVPLELGDSVAVQGVCLTVTSCDLTSFVCDVLDETLDRTNLGGKVSGDALNLERAMKLGDRLGGHFVTGHVDAIGTISAIRMSGRDRIVAVKCDPETLSGIVEKGSIAIDGISLTVSAVSESDFEVNIIPFSWEHTSLSARNVGDVVNLETDMLGKYVAKYLLKTSSKAGVGMNTLASAGFLG